MSKPKKTGRRKLLEKNRVRLVSGGKPYFDELHLLITRARLTLYLQFYIFLDDDTGQDVINALCAAAQRGVAVFLHLDGYASQSLHRKAIQQMRDCGIRFKWFEPLLRSKRFYFGRRLHHKVAVADSCYALVGGINVCDRYNDLPDDPAWLDMAVYVEGEVAHSLEMVCQELWGQKKEWVKTPEKIWVDFADSIPESERTLARVIRNDWVKRKMEIWGAYLHQFNGAEKEITIMCSYFLPGRLYRRKLAQATRRGVKVRVVLAGVSDIMIAKHAERYLYRWLLKNNIEVYEYQRTILHAKVSISDGTWSTIGSYNVNNISAYASLELNIEVENPGFAISTKKTLDQLIEKDCQRITLENYEAHTNWLKRFWQRTCYRFINNVLNLFTFYFRQE